MRLVTVPEPIPIRGISPSVFLAGGITRCPQWQDEVIEGLIHDEDGAIAGGTIFNPRRRNFPIGDPDAAREQIAWEFHALHVADVFSMWFSDADSDQPICMYELGRYVAIRESEIPRTLETVVIGVEPGYRREQDVRIQIELINHDLASRISDNLEDHVQSIRLAMEKVCSDR